MEITGAIIIVQIDNDKAYQVDISSDNVKALLAMYQYSNDCSIKILDKPLIGLTLTKNVLKST